jgi:hypothetical protein
VDDIVKSVKGEGGNLQIIVQLLNNFLFICGLDINWDKSMAYWSSKKKE